MLEITKLRAYQGSWESLDDCLLKMCATNHGDPKVFQWTVQLGAEVVGLKGKERHSLFTAAFCKGS